MNDESVSVTAKQGIQLPEPDTDNITVLTENLPNEPILPWHHYDSPWLEQRDEAEQQDADAAVPSNAEPERDGKLAANLEKQPESISVDKTALEQTVVSSTGHPPSILTDIVETTSQSVSLESVLAQIKTRMANELEAHGKLGDLSQTGDPLTTDDLSPVSPTDSRADNMGSFENGYESSAEVDQQLPKTELDEIE